MPNLKLGFIRDEKPVKLTVELPAGVHRDLVTYTETLARETGQAVEAAQLVGPMLARFMATDRAFAKARRSAPRQTRRGAPSEIETAPGSESS